MLCSCSVSITFIRESFPFSLPVVNIFVFSNFSVFLIEIIGQATYTGSGPSAGSSKSINEIVLFKKICFRENGNCPKTF